MIPGLVILMVGFALFAFLGPRGRVSVSVPPPEPEANTSPSSTNLASSPTVSPTLAVDLSLVSTQAISLQFGKGTPAEMNAAPQPAGPQESREVSCPICGGRGSYAINGKDETCPRCSGSGRCRMSVTGQN